MTDFTRREIFRAAGAAAAIRVFNPLDIRQTGTSAMGAGTRERNWFHTLQDIAKHNTSPSGTAADTNGDEERYLDKRASFSKTLPHNEFGEVQTESYEGFRSILEHGGSVEFESLPRSSQAQIKLDNPQAAYAFCLEGRDSHCSRIAPPPAFASPQMAMELVELYWQALTRDIPFSEYESNSLIQAAIADLNACSAARNQPITAQTLFRAIPGVGPYISQFLWLQVSYGIAVIDQRYTFPVRGQNFLTDYNEWLACQQGLQAKAKLSFSSQPRYISSNRELAEFVHQDFSFQAYLNAALIILKFGTVALSPTNPYRSSKSQFGDITFGQKEILAMLAQVSQIAQKGVYFQKWLVHRRIRPEGYAARVHHHRSGSRKYDLHPDILHCDAVERVFKTHHSYLLPQAFPEGSPTHPSYPAAHACNAGACSIVLKAFFDEDFCIPAPVQAGLDGSALEPWKGEPLTLGMEIDKLACNISLGRNAAGIHYPSDAIHGLTLGEEIGLKFLQDCSRTYKERFDGFTLTRFQGHKVRIINGRIVDL